MITIDGINYYELTDTNVLAANESDLYLYKTFAGDALIYGLTVNSYDVYEVTVRTVPTLGYKQMLIHIKEDANRSTNSIKNYSITYTTRTQKTLNFSVNLGNVATLPIWKDTYCSLDGGNYIDYRITADNTEIYKGRCYSFDGECKFKLNEVCRNYLANSIDFSNVIWQENNEQSKLFNVYIITDEVETLYSQTTFWNDWSYTEYTEPESHYLSNPIIPIADKRQYFLFSGLFDASTVNTYASTTLLDSTQFTGVAKTYVKYIPSIDVPLAGEFTEAFNSDFLVWRSTLTVDEYTVNYNNWKTFTVKNTCKRYCLYYLNARGGWDWLVIDGNEVKNYNFTRQTYLQNYNNTTLESGKVNYRNDIQETWNLTTGFLTDSQSSQMYNLFGSVSIYLHDLETGKILPVVITNNSQTEKTFKNQGRKLYNYTITVESAQNKIRM